MFELIRKNIGKSTVVYKLEDAANFEWFPMMALDIETGADGHVPGDVATYSGHRVIGVALCNPMGDARYFVIAERTEDNVGIPLTKFISYLNEKLKSVTTLVMHNGKFDVGFLQHRGMNLPQNIRWVDTHLFMSLRRAGVFASNRLKDLVKEFFHIATETKDEIEKFFEANNTRDFGCVPAELLARYACDDVRYTLMVLLALPTMTEAERKLHDLYVENNKYLIEAELRGVAIDRHLMVNRMKLLKEQMPTQEQKLREQLGAAEVDPNDEQAMLRYLHGMGLHPGPREMFGEVKFVYDKLAVRAVYNHPLIEVYQQYRARQMFIKAFSPSQGNMKTRFFDDGSVCGFYPSFWPSVFSKGGLVECRAPDIRDLVEVANEVRELFHARPSYKFVCMQATQLPEQLMGRFTQDKELTELLQIRTTDAYELFARRLGVKVPEARAVAKNLFDGFGNAALLHRLKAEGSSIGKKDREHYAFADKFKTVGLPGYQKLQAEIQRRLSAEKAITDCNGRVLCIPQEKVWRASALLMQSSYGGLLAESLAIYCRLAKTLDAKLVMAHDTELVFEVPENNTEFEKACMDVSNQRKMPRFQVRTDVKWVGADEQEYFA